MTGMNGHVFVVHSRMEGIQIDAAVVPTGGRFRVRDYWGPVLGISEKIDDTHLAVAHLRPRRWRSRGFGRASDRRGQRPPSRPGSSMSRRGLWIP